MCLDLRGLDEKVNEQSKQGRNGGDVIPFVGVPFSLGVAMLINLENSLCRGCW